MNACQCAHLAQPRGEWHPLPGDVVMPTGNVAERAWAQCARCGGRHEGVVWRSWPSGQGRHGHLASSWRDSR